MGSKKEYKRDAVEFVRIGYNDACTNFKVWFHSSDFDLFSKAVYAAGEYNAFRPPLVNRAFAQIKDLLRSVEFGREGSPVMYLELKSEHKDNHAVAFNIRSTFISTTPSEFNVRPDGKIRIWWD